jgi:hypothetical protein
VTLAALGLLLLAAAALKVHQLATEPTAEEDWLTGRSFLTVWVEVEIVLGLWFVSSLARRLAWATALACFSLFALVSLLKALEGEASCGCFGRLEVDPWYALVLDVGCIVALLVFRPPLRAPLRSARARVRLAAVVLLALAAGIPAAVLAIRYEPARLSSGGEILGDQRIVLLEPETWVGKPCPLLGYIDIGDRLARGRWIAVLYHHDCPHCQRRVPEFERETRRRAGRAGIAQTAMVELPPYAPPGRSLLPSDTPCLKGRVRDVRDWFVTTPTILALNEGTVTEVPEEGHSEAAGPAAPVVSPPSPNEEALPVSDEGYDFGFVEPESTHQVLLAVPNASTNPLRILKVRSECRCMTAAVSDQPVAPGEPLKVAVKLVAPKESMRYAKRVLLVTSDPKHSMAPVWIRADIGLALAVKPSPLDLGTLAVGETREGHVTVVNRSKNHARLLYSTSSTPGCVARVPAEAVSAGGAVTLPISVEGRTEGTVKTCLHVITDILSQRDLPVVIEFTVRSEAHLPEGTKQERKTSEGASGEETRPGGT